MKAYFCLFSLLIFLIACDSTEKARSADADKPRTELTQVAGDTAAMPSGYSVVDTIPAIDSIVFEEPKNPLEYMTIEEKSMIDEINLLRADPQAYARFVDEYLQMVVTDQSMDDDIKRNKMAAAGKLIIDLQTIEPLPALLPHYKLYLVAKMHGQDMAVMKKVDPIGSDGSHPFQRIHDGAGLDGSENLVFGYTSIRKTILSILIEGGEVTDNQKLNLLDPQWEFIACYEAGAIGDKNHVWVQLTGFALEEILDEDVEIIENTIVEDIDAGEIEVIQPTVVLGNGARYSFLTMEEKEMINEINLLRSNPSGYIRFVDDYSEKYEKLYSAEDDDFKIAVKELKETLRNAMPLSQLKPHQGLYNVAKAHGLDNQSHNRFEHTGTDRSDSFDRVKRSGLKNYIDEKGYFAPNENLVGGEETSRESVVALLIDSGVSSRGHREALLHPAWKYVACYKIGLIKNLKELKEREKDDMNNCWVQLFATD